MSPVVAAEAIRSGRTVSFADMKYGWPHKLYLDDGYQGHYKFYTIHLKDATEADKALIEKACGLTFKFDVKVPGDIAWEPCQDNPINQQAG
jgi:hypothetical protein